jgi:hypothetical protein
VLLPVVYPEQQLVLILQNSLTAKPNLAILSNYLPEPDDARELKMQRRRPPPR